MQTIIQAHFWSLICSSRMYLLCFTSMLLYFHWCLYILAWGISAVIPKSHFNFSLLQSLESTQLLGSLSIWHCPFRLLNYANLNINFCSVFNSPLSRHNLLPFINTFSKSTSAEHSAEDTNQDRADSEQRDCRIISSTYMLKNVTENWKWK